MLFHTVQTRQENPRQVCHATIRVTKIALCTEIAYYESMKYVRVFLIIAILLGVAIFFSQNTTAVTVSFFSWSTTGSMSLYLILSLIIGLLLGIILMIPATISSSFKHYSTRKKLQKMETEVNNQTNENTIGSRPAKDDTFL